MVTATPAITEGKSPTGLDMLHQWKMFAPVDECYERNYFLSS
jgi:hypothetical protein